MPPRGKQSPEAQQATFDAWKDSAEWAAIENLMKEIQKIDEVKKGGIQLSDVDISINLQPFLNALFQLVQDFKTPGRKAKSYEQQFIRTMFWEKIEQLKKTIDGVEYEFSSAANQDCFNSKEGIVNITGMLDPMRMEGELTPENLSSWKKELIKFCKEFDKSYVKHAKSIYPEMNAIHMAAMKPLTLLIEANSNFHKLEIMIKDKKEVPAFRYDALETEFCKYLTGVCQIFRDYGQLQDHFDIRQMLKVLKIEKWQMIPPFKYYLMPLMKSIEKLRKNLLQMEKDGVLMIKYVIEDNKELQDDTIDMIKQDGIVQWLVGDELKQDQFRFMYDTAKIIYDSALQGKLLQADPVVLESILPKLVAFRSIMSIRNIQLRKAAEFKKIKDKAELNGIPASKIVKDPKHMTEEELIAWRMEQVASGENTGISKTEAQLQAEMEEKERKEYGRFWVWEGYFSEKNKEKWLQCAEDLKHINDHVIQDIEDSILLEAFKGQKANKIEQFIDSDHKDRIANAKKLMPTKDGEDYEAKALNEMKKRRFMNEIRPPMYWNFFEDGPEIQKVKHVLRYNAKPTESYIDGRVDKILQVIEEIGMSLQRYEENNWAMLRKRTCAIFNQEFIEFKKQLEDAG